VNVLLKEEESILSPDVFITDKMRWVESTVAAEKIVETEVQNLNTVLRSNAQQIDP
jgi:hypothetical protein